MKSFIRVKRINGREYLYEITPYYDPVQKKIRQKSRYLGKNVDGIPVRVRQKSPKRAYSCGEFIPFLAIIEEMGIYGALSEYFGRQELNTLVVLILNRILRPLPGRLIPAWYEGTVLFVKFGKLPLSPVNLRAVVKKAEEIGAFSLVSVLRRRFGELADGIADLSEREVLLELEKIRAVEMSDGMLVLTEFSGRHRAILRTLLKCANPELEVYSLLATRQ